jgi:hypothetical protein
VDSYLAIDATGSMGASPCNAYQTQSGCPIKEAKDAAAGFVDVLLDGNPDAGYSQVGVGAFRGCYNPPRSSTYYGRQRCVTVSEMVHDLSTSKTDLTSTISGIWAIGHTAGSPPLQPSDGSGTNVCLGMYKGNEILFGPGGQTASNTLKLLVVLSDGDNTYYAPAAYGDGQPPAECRPSTGYSSSDIHVDTQCRSAQTRERSLDIKTEILADTLKSQGVEIYVVAFGVCGTDNPSQLPTDGYCSGIGDSAHDNTADRRLLKCIASSTAGTNDHYFEALTAGDLPSIYNQIASGVASRPIR